MSRIGKKPVAIPQGVTVKVDGNTVDVKGPKGQMRQPLPPGVLAAVEDGQLVTRKTGEERELNKFHGLARSLVNNAVLGVTEGWKKELDIVGVGYRAELKGKQIVLALGCSHPIVYDVPVGIEIAIDETRGPGFHTTGAVYDLVKPEMDAMKPTGQWSHIEITCDRNRIEVELTGRRVTPMDLDEWTTKPRRPDGSGHKFDVAYADHPRTGYIGLQDHGSDCWYRNIKILPLT